MALLGSFAYQTSSSLLQEISIRQLDALAQSKAHDIEKVNEAWKDQVRLIKGGSGLVSLVDAHQNGDEQSTEQLMVMGNHSIDAISDLVQIKIIEGNTTLVNFGTDLEYSSPVLPVNQGLVQHFVLYGGSFFDKNDKLHVVYSSYLEGHDNKRVEVVFNARALNSISGDYTGLGETGEILLVKLEANTAQKSAAKEKKVVRLNPRRFKGEGEISEFHHVLEQSSDAVQRVLSGQSGIFDDGHKDYRGRTVWAATRFIEELNLGLIVKVDSTEEQRRADFLRDALFDIALALSAFAIVGGSLLGFYLARPIHELAVLVGRMRQGEFGLRAEVKGDDEIAYLSDSLNELLDHVQKIEKNQPSTND